MYSFNTINVEITDDIAVVKFARPKQLNALNTEMTAELTALFDRFAEDDNVRGIILTGEGRSFMAGADISEMLEWGCAEGREFARLSNKAFSKIADISKPVICAINGFALGGGFELSLCCDWRIASENAVLGAPELNIGIIPSGGGTQRLARLIGSGRAKELIFTCKKLSAYDAEKIGIVNKVVKADELVNEAFEEMKAVLSHSSVALKYAKESINSGLDVDLKTGIGIEVNAVGMVFASEDKNEGVKAFLEKRKPEFKNR